MFPNLHWDVGILQRKAKKGEYSVQPIWGYIVYIATYKDQKMWDDYVKYVYQAVRETVDWKVASDWSINDILPPSYRVDSEDKLRAEGEVVKNTFNLCIREGPEFNGRSLEEIREINVSWFQSLNELPESEFSQLPGCLPDHLDRDKDTRSFRMARCDYLIYVDDEILDEFQAIRTAHTTDEEPEFAPSFKHNVAVKVALGDYSEVPDSSDSNSDSEPDPDTTKIWQFLHAYRLPRFYDSLVNSNEAWWDHLRRPPRLNLFPLD